jgi:glutamate synthase (NADH) large subunit (EC 1.4.1.14)
LTLVLEGEANDYVGKGLSGAKIALKTPADATYKQDENFIAGNTILYGATSGKLFVNGCVGERFGVRNSGATAVVEGVGDHCCEYMTGGMVVVLGRFGRNFAAGMSGGIAYVLDEKDNFNSYCNTEFVDIDIPEEEDVEEIRALIVEHYNITGSRKAAAMLEQWDEVYSTKFKKVIPRVYKQILKAKKEEEKIFKQERGA